MVAGLILYVTGAGKSSKQHQTRSFVAGSGTSAANQPDRYGAFDLGIVYGSTPKQVLSRLGSPTKEQAHCWLYRGRVGSIRGHYPGPYVDAMKFCFSEGPAGGTAVTRILNHLPIHSIIKRDPVTNQIISKQTFPAQWGISMAREMVPDWYLEQNS